MPKPVEYRVDLSICPASSKACVDYAAADLCIELLDESCIWKASESDWVDTFLEGVFVIMFKNNCSFSSES